MLTGDKLQIFYKYVEDIMGRPVYTHEMAIKAVADEIKEKSQADFMALCTDESSSENPSKWIPVSERLPEENDVYLVAVNSLGCPTRDVDGFMTHTDRKWEVYGNKVIAWMPLPKPYKAEKEV